MERQDARKREIRAQKRSFITEAPLSWRFVIFSIFERITNVEISATNTKNNVITSTVIRYTFNFPATFKLAIRFLIFSIIVFPSFVNY